MIAGLIDQASQQVRNVGVFGREVVGGFSPGERLAGVVEVVGIKAGQPGRSGEVPRVGFERGLIDLGGLVEGAITFEYGG